MICMLYFAPSFVEHFCNFILSKIVAKYFKDYAYDKSFTYFDKGVTYYIYHYGWM